MRQLATKLKNTKNFFGSERVPKLGQTNINGTLVKGALLKSEVLTNILNFKDSKIKLN